jgi:hypothetical protein
MTELKEHLIRGARVIFSKIDREHAEPLAALLRQPLSPTVATGVPTPAATISRVLFLGVQESPPVMKMFGGLIAANFGVIAYSPAVAHQVHSHDLKGGVLVAHPSRWGLVAVAKALDFTWEGQHKDAASFRLPGDLDDGMLSPAGLDIDRIFKSLPPFGSATFADTLAEVVNLFLPTTLKGGKDLPRARGALAAWFELHRTNA